MVNTYRERCSRCNDVFPCLGPCQHWDCQEARVEANAPLQGDLRKVHERIADKKVPDAGQAM